jgi:AraC-like DNA-binding protein
MLANLSFSLAEVAALLGLAQCVYILVHIALRAGAGSHALLPVTYFAVLGAAFFGDLAASMLGADWPALPDGVLTAWCALPALGAVLVVQLATIPDGPRARDFWPLALAGVALGAAWALAPAEDRAAWLALGGCIAGALALAALWARPRLFTALRAGADGANRYWLALALIAASAAFVAASLAWLAGALDGPDFAATRTILGLALVYLAMTSVLRIYPQAVQIAPRARAALSEDDRALAARIEGLLDLDKVYQEPTYGRADMARELGVPEAAVSRVVTAHFGESLPRLLNARRVADAQQLLTETDAPIGTIAGEVGFNSLASFNRVFREVTGTTPSVWRSRPR